MHPGPPLSEPSSSAGAPSSSTILPLTVYAGSEQGPVKGKPSPQVRAHPKLQKRMPLPQKGGKKGKNKGKDKGGHKGKGKGKHDRKG